MSKLSTKSARLGVECLEGRELPSGMLLTLARPTYTPPAQIARPLVQAIHPPAYTVALSLHSNATAASRGFSPSDAYNAVLNAYKAWNEIRSEVQNYINQVYNYIATHVKSPWTNATVVHFMAQAIRNGADWASREVRSILTDPVTKQYLLPQVNRVIQGLYDFANQLDGYANKLQHANQGGGDSGHLTFSE